MISDEFWTSIYAAAQFSASQKKNSDDRKAAAGVLANG
jgi:hypothetical protein